MNRVIILNGPPRSGKDTLYEAMELSGLFQNLKHCRFKTPLMEIASSVLGYSPHEFSFVYEQVKDKPCNNGLPLTVRQLMIKISEEWVKPLAGKDYFGKIALQHIKNELPFNNKREGYAYNPAMLYGHTVIFTDGGFGEEILPFIADPEIGPHNVHIVRIHKQGIDFSEDSRRYMDEDVAGLEDCNFYDIHNNGTVKDLADAFFDNVVMGIRYLEKADD